MAKVLSEKEKKFEKKYINMRRVCIVTFVIGFSLFVSLNIGMGGHGAKGIGEVYGIFLGGLMVFAGGVGICSSTLFLKLLRKDKKKSW
ncbi:MAG: hypothetical protein Q9M11_00460 [Mariprofundaceae bacterium]|nr:hypothetical protein [Mariprofundaceae bacterium]